MVKRDGVGLQPLLLSVGSSFRSTHLPGVMGRDSGDCPISEV